MTEADGSSELSLLEDDPGAGEDKIRLDDMVGDAHAPPPPIEDVVVEFEVNGGAGGGC